MENMLLLTELNIRVNGNTTNNMDTVKSAGQTGLITKAITRMERRISAVSWYGEMEIDMLANF